MKRIQKLQSAVEEGDSIKISINDTGTGIPMDKLSFIFDRFCKANGTIGSKYGGVGLGLYISKEIIKMHNAGCPKTKIPMKMEIN